MAISLSTVVVRHERRVQLVFSTALASGAFTTLSLYTLANLDSLATDPTVVAAFIAPGNPNAVELALGVGIASGVLYSISAIGVPALDASVTPAGSTLPLRTGNAVGDPNAEVNADDTLALLFGVDIVHDGVDYVEDATGDLATISGPANGAQAVLKRLLSEGVSWNPSYGGKPRQYVDGAPGELPTLKGELLRQAYLDDRVKKVTSELLPDASDPAVATIRHTVQFVGVTGTVPVNVSIPGS